VKLIGQRPTRRVIVWSCALYSHVDTRNLDACRNGELQSVVLGKSNLRSLYLEYRKILFLDKMSIWIVSVVAAWSSHRPHQRPNHKPKVYHSKSKPGKKRVINHLLRSNCPESEEKDLSWAIFPLLRFDSSFRTEPVGHVIALLLMRNHIS
jgi:hypothetical protein